MIYKEEEIWAICDECNDEYTGVICTNRCGFPEDSGLNKDEWNTIIRNITRQLDKE